MSDPMAEHARKNMNEATREGVMREATHWSTACALHRIAAALERIADQGEPRKMPTEAFERVTAQTPGAEPREGGENGP